MRHTTPEQKAKAEERRTKLRDIIKQVNAMTDDQKAQLSATMPALVNPEGHYFTLHNTLLIASQGARNPTILGGFKQWMKQGRAVKKGEHGYMILFPREKKNGDDPQPGPEEQEKPEVRFLIGYVFDISQTQEIETST
jgi:antirestriction protein ArdC